MVALDRAFVITDAQARRASRAAFVAWHHMLRPWRRYAAYLVIGSVLSWGRQDISLAALIPLAVIGDCYPHFRQMVEDTRNQIPVGTTIALGFGTEAFAYRTWIHSGEVPYTAVQKVVTSSGCVVIIALSERIFWPLPQAHVPAEALLHMSATSAQRPRKPHD